MNREQFSALHYTAPGTDIIIGLPKNHLWEGAGSYNARGEKFMANMPTEEVFTAPDSHRVDGYISSTKPLSYAGTIISGMKFTFKDGKVVDFSAEQGEDVLAKLLDTDEGARRLGEVALVPDPSPISQSGIIFFNTLFDENASNHLALGSAYAFSVKGGTEMSDEELAEAGLNRSQTHVDFMVGSTRWISTESVKMALQYRFSEMAIGLEYTFAHMQKNNIKHRIKDLSYWLRSFISLNNPTVFLYGTLKRKVVSINPSAITKNNKKSSPVHSHWLYVKLQVIPLELRTIYLSLDRTGISQSKSFNSNLLKYENQLHRRPSKFFFSNQFFPIFSSTVY